MYYEIGACNHKRENHLAELNFVKIILYLMGCHYGYFVQGVHGENFFFRMRPFAREISDMYENNSMTY